MGGLKFDGAEQVCITMKLSDALKTTTANYTPVCLNPSNASDLTVHGVEETSSDEKWAFGILQGDNSANSVTGRVCVLGRSKAYAGAAISAGQFVYPAGSSLGTTDVGGTVLAYDISDVGTVTGAGYVVLGRALEAAAATGDALTIFVNPHISFMTV